MGGGELAKVALNMSKSIQRLFWEAGVVVLEGQPDELEAAAE